jgi:hypothetical protein
MATYSYEKELWDGMNIVNNRCEEAKNTLADMIKLFDVRASLESDYSKKLQQLCSKPSSTPEARFFYYSFLFSFFHFHFILTPYSIL